MKTTQELKEKEDVENNTWSDTIHNDNIVGTCNRNDTVSLNNFQDFGFTADFEGKILGQTDIGAYVGEIHGQPTIWLINGECHFTEYEDGYWNLTPIKRPWYEYPENFPKLVKAIDSEDYLSMRDKQNYLDYISSGKWRLATKAELNSLYVGEDDD